jgi:hypothetical protein
VHDTWGYLASRDSSKVPYITLLVTAEGHRGFQGVSPWDSQFITMHDAACVGRDSLKVLYITLPKATSVLGGRPPRIVDLLQYIILLVSRDSSKVPSIYNTPEGYGVSRRSSP